MTDTTPILGLDELVLAQSQPHIPINKTSRKLEAVVQLSVKDKDLGTPPGSPADGDRYIIAGPGTGAWQGRADQVAVYQDGAGWLYLVPRSGWLAYVADEDAYYRYSGGSPQAWVSFSGGGGGSLTVQNLGSPGASVNSVSTLTFNGAVVTMTGPGQAQVDISGGGGGGSPGGSNTQIQYNNSGSFGGSASFTWDDSTKKQVIVGVAGNVGWELNSGSGNSPKWKVASADGTTLTIQQLNSSGFAVVDLASSQAGIRFSSATTSFLDATPTEFIRTGVEFDQSFNISNPSNGATVNVGSTEGIHQLEPAGGLATLTVNFPTTTKTGRIIKVATTQAIAALSVTASGGASVNNAPTSLAAGQGFAYWYRASNTTWYRLY